MLETMHRNGLELITAPRLEAECGVRAAFTNRLGGAGVAPYDSLNLSFNVGDDRRTVLENRMAVAAALEAPLSRWVLCGQVHGAGVRLAGGLDAARGATDLASALPRTDAVVTREPGLATAVLVADCLPLLMMAPARRCVAAVHAGWRGVVAGVAPRALASLTKLAGCQPSDVVVLVGPHIRSCCMEVDEVLAREFSRSFGPDCLTHLEESTGLDLERACLSGLFDLGVEGGNVWTVGSCTMCGDGYFSHRREAGKTGRQAGVISILP